MRITSRFMTWLAIRCVFSACYTPPNSGRRRIISRKDILRPSSPPRPTNLPRWHPCGPKTAPPAHSFHHPGFAKYRATAAPDLEFTGKPYTPQVPESALFFGPRNASIAITRLRLRGRRWALGTTGPSAFPTLLAPSVLGARRPNGFPHRI